MLLGLIIVVAVLAVYVGIMLAGLRQGVDYRFNDRPNW